VHAAGVRRGRVLLVSAAAAVLVAVFAAAPAWAAPPQAGAGAAAARTTTCAAPIKDGRAAARPLLAQSGAASISVAPTARGRVVWQQGFGYADVATKTAPGLTVHPEELLVGVGARRRRSLLRCAAKRPGRWLRGNAPTARSVSTTIRSVRFRRGG